MIDPAAPCPTPPCPHCGGPTEWAYFGYVQIGEFLGRGDLILRCRPCNVKVGDLGTLLAPAPVPKRRSR